MTSIRACELTHRLGVAVLSHDVMAYTRTLCRHACLHACLGFFLGAAQQAVLLWGAANILIPLPQGSTCGACARGGPGAGALWCSAPQGQSGRQDTSGRRF